MQIFLKENMDFFTNFSIPPLIIPTNRGVSDRPDSAGRSGLSSILGIVRGLLKINLLLL